MSRRRRDFVVEGDLGGGAGARCYFRKAVLQKFTASAVGAGESVTKMHGGLSAKANVSLLVKTYSWAE
ncbi:hypothetical protein [Brevinema andersonii]|uniref:hypothetical protein n=1 Tax=Brevinema andersonii TaxID=34097 RepID=UPI001178C784|nr:hypothetical protein [Brevinema andersonii]